MASQFEMQLESVIAAYDAALASSRYTDGSDMGPAKHHELFTACAAAIERAAGRESIYYEQALKNAGGNQFIHLANIVGTCRALVADIRNGYLHSFTEMIHGGVHADYLEMADHLVESGYKDAAAVIAGSTLEAHLRNLCAKHDLSMEVSGKPKKADTVNSELAKAGAYGKLDLKNVTAWLGLRNDAAHGNYTAYDNRQVALLISSIREFISRHPA